MMCVLFLKWDNEYISLLKELNKEVILLVDDYDIREHYSKIVESGFPRYQVRNITNLQEVIAAACEIKTSFNNTITHLISFTDYSQYASSILANILEIPYPDLRFMTATRDKRLMKAYAKKLGIETANFLTIKDLEDDKEISHLAETIPFPFIVKPADGTGSQGVKLIKNYQDLTSWKSNIIASLKKENLRNCFMVEEYIEGEEYHVDLIWYQGEVKYKFVGRNYVPLLATVGNKAPNASVQLQYETNQDLFEGLVGVAEKIFKNIGMYSGATMTECFVNRDGRILFSELSARLSGGGINECIKHILGEGEGLKKLDIRAKLGLFKENLPKKEGTFGFINLLPQQPGIIKKISSGKDLLAIDGVVEVVERAQIGDEINFNTAANWCTFAIVRGENEEHVYKIFDSLLKQYICITTPPSGAVKRED